MPTTDELFHQVYLHPADEAQKLVLADRLLEEGDPRGEFIALQLRHDKGSLPPSGVKREKRLLEENEIGWLAPIRKALMGELKWRHGFLDECGARLSGTTTGALEWSTVRRLILYNTDQNRPEELARDFRSLQTLERANTHALDVLVKSSERPPVSALSYVGPMRQLREWVPRQVDALLKLAELPYLKRLALAPPTPQEFTGKDFAFFFDSALARKLEHLTFSLLSPFVRGGRRPALDLGGLAKGAESLPLATLTVELQGIVSYQLANATLTVRALTTPAMTGQLLPAMMAPLRGLDPKAIARFELIYPGKRLAKRHLFAVEEAAKRFKQVNAVEYRAASPTS